MVNRSNVIDIIMILIILILIGVVILKDRQLSASYMEIAHNKVLITKLNQFKYAALEFDIPRNFIKSKFLNEIVVKDKSGDDYFLKDILSPKPQLILTFNSECLTCIDKHFSCLSINTEDIILAGFPTYRKFLAFESPYINSTKLYYINSEFYDDLFGISQGIMSFVYHSQIGSSLQYNHTYEKNDISTVHFRIIKEFLDNE